MSLSKESKAEVLEIIELWYLSWKDKITTDGTPHSFGFAKEELKRRLSE